MVEREKEMNNYSRENDILHGERSKHRDRAE
jgi:hypothetical protein